MHSDKLRVLLVHIPKTGGESLGKLLKGNGFHGDKHLSYRDFVLRHGRDRAARMRVVSFVRNPWDQVLSLYSHLRKPVYLDKSDISPYAHYFADGQYLNPLVVSRSACGMEFKDWVAHWYGTPIAPSRAGWRERLAGFFPGGLSRCPASRRLAHADDKRLVQDDIPYLMPYLNWLEDSAGQPRADFVGRFESFEDDAMRLMSWLGIPAKALPHVNKSQRGDYREQYDGRTRAIVEKWYAREISAFDYRF